MQSAYKPGRLLPGFFIIFTRSIAILSEKISPLPSNHLPTGQFNDLYSVSRKWLPVILTSAAIISLVLSFVSAFSFSSDLKENLFLKRLQKFECIPVLNLYDARFI